MSSVKTAFYIDSSKGCVNNMAEAITVVLESIGANRTSDEVAKQALKVLIKSFDDVVIHNTISNCSARFEEAAVDNSDEWVDNQEGEEE